MNKMQEIQIEKLTLNIGTGGPGEPLEKAMRLLEKIAGSKPVPTKAKKRIPTWGIRLGLQIGSKVVLRGKKAEELLIRLLKAVGDTLSENNFDNQGNFSIGIKEYLDIPKAEYDMSIGIIGLEAAITLKRPGYRIRRRAIQTKKIPRKHSISKSEAINFIKTKFNTRFEA